MSKKKRTKKGRDQVLLEFFDRKNTRRALGIMKNERSYAASNDLLQRMGLHMRPDLKKVLYGICKASTWDEVFDLDFLPKSKNWINELSWMTITFREHADLINSFLVKRKIFGRHFLLGEFESASAILDEVNHQHGKSLWAAERELMLAQEMRGFEDHKAVLSNIQNDVTDNLLAYIVTTISSRLEPFVTHESFVSKSDEVYHGLKEATALLADVHELHTHPWAKHWSNNALDVMHVCSSIALIDRYEKAMKITSSIYDELSQTDSEKLAKVLSRISGRIADRQIDRILAAVSDSGIDVDIDSDNFYEVYDYFIKGDYHSCFLETQSFINKDPTCFQYYVLAASSAACIDEVEIEVPKKSISYDILSKLITVFKNVSSVQEPLEELLTRALKLGDNCLGINLWRFCSYELYSRSESFFDSRVYAQSKVDYFESYSVTKKTSSGWLDLPLIYAHHDSVKLYLNTHEITEILGPISPVIASVFQARRMEQEGDYKEVLDVLAAYNFADRPDWPADVMFFGIEIARLRFCAHFSNGDAVSAAQELVRQYIFNQNNLRHIPFERLVDGCLAGNWPEVKATHYWPIITLLDNRDEQTLYEAVDDYLSSLGLFTPTDLLDPDVFSEIPVPEFTILLKDVLIPNVIARGALWRSTESERREMRKMILQFLYRISETNQPYVLSELSKIESAAALEAAYTNVEGAKFELDYTQLNVELNELLIDKFLRYLEYRDFEESGGVVASEAELLNRVKLEASVGSVESELVKSSVHQLGGMINHVFVEYLLNQGFGINASLGTRVRHGAIDNQLTRGFGNDHMLTKETSEGVVVLPSRVATMLNHLESPIVERLKTSYNSLTMAIRDELDSLVKDRLRVKVPEHVMSLINQFGFKSTELTTFESLFNFCPLFEESFVISCYKRDFRDVESFVSFLELKFVNLAEQSFNQVNSYLRGEFSLRIHSSLDEVQKCIKKEIPEGDDARASLISDVVNAKDELSKDVMVVSNWFSTSKSSSMGVKSIQELAMMAARVVDFASNGLLGEVKFDEFENVELSTDAYRVIYEIYSILFRNVVQHSCCGSESQDVFCTHVKEYTHQRITVSNLLGPEACGNKLLTRGVKLIDSALEELSLGANPGGTGLRRVFRLLRNIDASRIAVKLDYDKKNNCFTTEVEFKL